MASLRDRYVSLALVRTRSSFGLNIAYPYMVNTAYPYMVCIAYSHMYYSHCNSSDLFVSDTDSDDDLSHDLNELIIVWQVLFDQEFFYCGSLF